MFMPLLCFVWLPLEGLQIDMQPTSCVQVRVLCASARGALNPLVVVLTFQRQGIRI